MIHVSNPKINTACTTALKIYHIHSGWLFPGPGSSSAVPNYSLPSSSLPSPPDSCRALPSRRILIIYSRWPYQPVFRRPQRPSPHSPASPLPPEIGDYSLTPWRTGQWQGASWSVISRAQACCTGGTMDGGGFPPPKWWRCPGHSGDINEPALPPIMETPKLGSSLGTWQLGKPSCRYTASNWGPWLSNSVSWLLPSHSASIDGLPLPLAQSPPFNMCTIPVHAVSTWRKAPLPSSVARTPPPTVLSLPGWIGVIFKLYSRRWYEDPPWWTALPGCWTPPVAILRLTTISWHHTYRRYNFGVCPPVPACPDPPLPLPSHRPIVLLQHSQPRWRWWGTAGTPALPPWRPRRPTCSIPPDLATTLLQPQYVWRIQ